MLRSIFHYCTLLSRTLNRSQSYTDGRHC